MTDIEYTDEYTDEKPAFAWDMVLVFFLGALFSTIATSWRNRHWYNGRARHRASYIGTKDVVYASDLVWALRNERHQPIFHRMHDDTETVVLV